MMSVTMKCTECGSAISVYPNVEANKAKCDICSNVVNINFTKENENSILNECPSCGKNDFFAQKDFSRFVGVGLFIIASILSIWTYGVSFIVFYLVDYFLFQKLGVIAICYHCQLVCRNVKNIDKIDSFDHEKNDRIIYS